MAVEEHVIEVEDLRSMVVRIDREKRTVSLELPGNYDFVRRLYRTGDDMFTGKEKVFGTTMTFKRNTRRMGAPKGAKRVDS